MMTDQVILKFCRQYVILGISGACKSDASFRVGYTTLGIPAPIIDH